MPRGQRNLHRTGTEYQVSKCILGCALSLVGAVCLMQSREQMLAPGTYMMTLEGLVSHLQDLVCSLIEMGSLQQVVSKGTSCSA